MEISTFLTLEVQIMVIQVDGRRPIVSLTRLISSYTFRFNVMVIRTAFESIRSEVSKDTRYL